MFFVFTVNNFRRLVMLILKTILSVFIVHLLTITHIDAASTLSRLSGEALELAQASKRLFTVASSSGSIRNFSSKVSSPRLLSQEIS